MDKFIVFTRQLSESQSATVNSLGWDDHIWGRAYVDIGFIGRPDEGDQFKSLPTALFTLNEFGIYHRGYEIEFNTKAAEFWVITSTEKLEVIFEAGNIGAHNPVIKNFHKFDRTNSISTGDLVFDQDYKRGWICCSMGWNELPSCVVSYWSIKNITIDRVNRAQRKAEILKNFGENYKEISIEGSNEELRP